ncbi:hypothetical protein CKO28_16850 [Rhodovibrio sodomensis]|uniref:Lipoprotein n=1 Tax=Rhodovibrio sodomensis TaxID=1088 RepID=A0ABS1DK21_9PROT|nr:hypothetical protein [Rhodovibrio sodomensis]
MRIAAALLLVAALAGCRTSDIYNVQQVSLATPPAAEMTQIENAIERAGAGLGWEIKRADPDEPGHLIGRLPIRSHVAVVDIKHDTETFSITYKDSTNLEYDAEAGKIHSNYNGWIQNLRSAILRETSNIEASAGTST